MKNNKSQKDIPTGWQEVKLGDILTIGSGRDYKHLGKGNISVFGTGGYMASVDKPLHSGETVFIGRKGTIDKPFYYKGNFWTVDTLFYTYNYKDTIAKYINFVFQKINWKLYNEASGVPSLSKSTIEKIKFVFPSLPEQKRIVAVLETWDHAIEKLIKKIKFKKNIKKGLMQNLLTGKIRLVGFNEKWQMLKLGDVCMIKRGDMITKNTIVHGDIPVIAGGKNPAYYHNQYNYKGKTITISGSGASAGFVNYFSIPIFASDCSIVKGKENKANTDFIYYTMSDRQEYIFSLQSGGAQPHVYPKDLAALKINLPSLKEQIAIANILVIADKEIKSLEKKLSILKDQKKYLLNNLITGTIRTKA